MAIHGHTAATDKNNVRLKVRGTATASGDYLTQVYEAVGVLATLRELEPVSRLASN